MTVTDFDQFCVAARANNVRHFSMTADGAFQVEFWPVEPLMPLDTGPADWKHPDTEPPEWVTSTMDSPYKD